MLETVYNLLEEKGIINDFVYIPYRGSEIPAEVEYLLDELSELEESRIETHANRLMAADRNNDVNGLVHALQALGREVIRNTNILDDISAQ